MLRKNPLHIMTLKACAMKTFEGWFKHDGKRNEERLVEKESLTMKDFEEVKLYIFIFKSRQD